jgi:hypothetical protein
MTESAEELRRRLRVAVDPSATRASGQRDLIATILAPVLADFLQEARSANDARLSDQLEHLKRRIVLLDIRTRGQTERENRVLLNRIRNLERQVSQLRQGRK